MTVEKYPQAPILESAMSCIHGVSVANSCPECIDMLVEGFKGGKDAKGVTLDDIAALLKMQIVTDGQVLEVLANVVTAVEDMRYALTEWIKQASDKQQHKEGDASGQTAEAGGSDSAIERWTEEEVKDYKEAAGQTVKMLGFDPPLTDDKPIGKYGSFPDVDNLNGLE